MERKNITTSEFSDKAWSLQLSCPSTVEVMVAILEVLWVNTHWDSSGNSQLLPQSFYSVWCNIVRFFGTLRWFMAPSNTWQLPLKWASHIKPVMPHQKVWKPSDLWVNAPIPSLGGVLQSRQFWKGGDCIIKSTIPPHKISCLLVPILTWLKTQIS